jgi:hypothetical protein
VRQVAELIIELSGSESEFVHNPPKMIRSIAARTSPALERP